MVPPARLKVKVVANWVYCRAVCREGEGDLNRATLDLHRTKGQQCRGKLQLGMVGLVRIAVTSNLIKVKGVLRTSYLAWVRNYLV